MRCKLHPYANTAGVCAPCLRGRLLVLAAERDQATADCSSGSSPPPAAARDRRGRNGDRGGGGDVPHRRSDACGYASSRHGHGHSDHQPELLFFRTPQVGPAAVSDVHAEEEPEESRRKAARRRPSFLAALFGGGRRHGLEAERKSDPPRRSTSWLSAIVRRKRRPDTASSLPRPLDDDGPDSPGGSTTSSSWWFPSPSPARHHHRRHSRPSGTSGSSGGGGGGGGDGISGFAVCLSPLVRPSSVGGRCRRRQPPEPSSHGESHRRHLSAGGAASFGRNTSRKLADRGRFR